MRTTADILEKLGIDTSKKIIAGKKDETLHLDIDFISDEVKRKLKEAHKRAEDAVKTTQKALDGAGERVPIYIDGILVEMFASTIENLIRSGIATVVWPGTTTPVNKGEKKGGYPPIFIEEHIPM